MTKPTIDSFTTADRSNREVKSSTFTAYYGLAKNAADLYRAMTHLPHVDPDDIKYETLQGVLYMARKNDLAFTVKQRVLVIGEHQSTINYNMPLRSAIYYGRTMEKLVDPKAIYRKHQIPLPTPEFYLFYNGRDPQPPEQYLNLSSAYLEKTEKPMLELIVKVININPSARHPLLEQCHSLYEYSTFIQEIRDLEDSGLTRDEAISLAMDSCVKKGIMVDFIREHGSEVRNMLFTQFNLDDAKEVWQEEAREEALEEGIALGKTQGIKLGKAQGIELGKTQGIELGKTQGIELGEWRRLVKNINELSKNLHLSIEDACRGIGVTVDEYEHAKAMLNR